MATPSEIISATNTEEPGILERFWNSWVARRDDARRIRREKEIEAAIQAYDEMKRQYELLPTQKRARAIENYENNMRNSGIMDIYEQRMNGIIK